MERQKLSTDIGSETPNPVKYAGLGGRNGRKFFLDKVKWKIDKLNKN